MDRGAWWATVHEIAESQTRLRDGTELLGLVQVQESLAVARGI